jgi:hypothetical protein
MVPTLKKLQWDMVEEKGAALQFVVAKSDNIPTLKVTCISSCLCSASHLPVFRGRTVI